MDSEKKLAESLGIPYRIKKVKIGNYNINYFTAGKGKPLLLIHGANFGWGQWYPNIKEFSKHYKVYAIDLPGCGKSSYINFNSDNFENVWIFSIKKFIEKNSIKKMYILGHSTGGWFTLKLANLKVVDKIVLVNSVGFSKYTPIKFRLLTIKGFPGFLSSKLIKKTPSGWKKFLLSSMENNKNIKEEFVRYLYENSKKHTWQSPFKLLAKTVTFNGMKNSYIFKKKYLASITKPTLYIYGTKDNSFSLKDTKIRFKAIPDGVMHLIDNAGHVVNLDTPIKFNKLVINFLKS